MFFEEIFIKLFWYYNLSRLHIMVWRVRILLGWLFINYQIEYEIEFPNVFLFFTLDQSIPRNTYERGT